MRTDSPAQTQLRRSLPVRWRVPLLLAVALALTWCAVRGPLVLHRWQVDRKLDAIRAGMSVEQIQGILGVPPTDPAGVPVGCVPGVTAYVFEVSPDLTVSVTYRGSDQIIHARHEDKDRVWQTPGALGRG